MLDYLVSRFNSFTLGTHGLTQENLLSRSKKDFLYSPDSAILIVGVPAWGLPDHDWIEVKKWAEKYKSSFLTYQFPREILSDDYETTRTVFGFINQTFRKDIRELKNKYNFKKVVLIGVSLGSSYGSMIYKNNPDITHVLFICPGNNLAQNMWNGCRTQHLRKSYEEQTVNLDKLKELWHDLAPENNMPAPSVKFEIILGKYDQVIRYDEGKTLAPRLKSSGFNVVEKNYPGGHYVCIAYFLIFPKKFLKALLID